MPRRTPSPRRNCPQVEALEDRCVPAVAAGSVAGDWQLVAKTPIQPGVGIGVQANGSPAAAAGLDSLRAAYPGLTGAGYSVAVIDSGIDYLHPALGGGLGAGHKVMAGQNFVVNGNGYVSTYGAADPMDENGHGTNVAGIVAAKDAYYSGVAPDANLVALRVLDKNGRGTWEWVDEALQWVIDHRNTVRVDAINMSLGAGNYTGLTSDFLAIDGKLKALWGLGVVNVASGGNDFYTNAGVQGLQFPAISQWAISVGAVYDGNYGQRSWASGAVDYVTYTDKIASFTQRSSALNLLAPGALITSTGLSFGGTANYWTYAGSSQASPFVAGAAILVKQAYDAQGQGALATAPLIRDILRYSGDPLKDNAPASQDNVLHTGLTFPRLNVQKAIQLVNATLDPDGTQATATPLGKLGATTSVAGQFSSLADVDWYSFVPSSTGTYHLQVSGSAGAALGFYSALGGAGTSGAATADGAALDAPLAAGKTYWVRLAGKKAGAYKLAIAAPAPAGSGTLLPDRFEANDTRAAAKYIGSLGDGAVAGLTLNVPTDQDWYRFNTSVGGTRRLQVVSSASAGAATFTFFDETKGRERTLNATFVNGVAVLNVSLRTGVNYYLDVRSAAGKTTAYTVVFGAA